VETFVVFDREQGREAVAERLRRDLAAGGRAFIVCPRVAEADEGTEGVVMVNEKSGNGSGSGSGSDGGGSSSNVEQQQQLPELRAAEEEYNRLLETGALGKDVKVGLLHGRMKPAEKTAALDAFRKGETSVLISTSVVEVGVDVPEATAMVVEGADRFGLAQLHQLRGRVGRGGKDGVCVLMVRTERGAARLQPLVESDDGFRIAEADLKER
jgi:ATP-dependent DNA helicase RecG